MSQRLNREWVYVIFSKDPHIPAEYQGKGFWIDYDSKRDLAWINPGPGKSSILSGEARKVFDEEYRK